MSEQQGDDPDIDTSLANNTGKFYNNKLLDMSILTILISDFVGNRYYSKKQIKCSQAYHIYVYSDNMYIYVFFVFFRTSTIG